MQLPLYSEWTAFKSIWWSSHRYQIFYKCIQAMNRSSHCCPDISWYLPNCQPYIKRCTKSIDQICSAKPLLDRFMLSNSPMVFGLEEVLEYSWEQFDWNMPLTTDHDEKLLFEDIFVRCIFILSSWQLLICEICWSMLIVDLCRPIDILSWLWWTSTVCGQPPNANHILVITWSPVSRK